MKSETSFERQGQRLLQVGMALILYSSIEGFVIPHLGSQRIGLSAYTLSALQGVFLRAQRAAFQEGVIAIIAYSSAPTGLAAFALMLWGLRISQ